MAIPFDRREVVAATIEEITAFTIEVASKVLGTVVLSTPVGLPTSWKSPPPKGYQPGHARGSWQTTLNRAISSDNLVIDPGGASTISRGLRIIRRAKFDSNIIIASAAPYMEALDRGHSRQAGANFIAKAANRGANSARNDTKTMPQSKKVRPRSRKPI